MIKFIIIFGTYTCFFSIYVFVTVGSVFCLTGDDVVGRCYDVLSSIRYEKMKRSLRAIFGLQTQNDETKPKIRMKIHIGICSKQLWRYVKKAHNVQTH